jgi:hypothetical protein
MRHALLLLVMLAGCASNPPQAPPPPIVVPPNPVQQNEPPVPATSQPAPNPHPGLVTGSEVAKDVHQPPPPQMPVAGKIMRSVDQAKASPGAPDSPCTTAADCALTLVPPGGCCPTLCVPRAVTSQRALALESTFAACRRTAACAPSSCQPARNLVPACVTNHCIAQPVVR